MKRSLAAVGAATVALLSVEPGWAGEGASMDDVQRLCRDYIEGFGSPETDLVYHHRLNGPAGLGDLETPAEIAAGRVHGSDMPYGYGSGIQDVALENGHFLIALCEAHEATGDEALGALARRIFAGMRRVATVSPVPGFVPRGPHPDGKSYYRDSSLDQYTTFVYALWRYHHSPLASEEDKAFISVTLAAAARRLEQYGWGIRVEDGSRQAHVGFSWLQFTPTGATVLLAVLAAVTDVTGDEHWQTQYRELGAEKDGLRWKLLSLADEPQWAFFTLYSNQFAVGLWVLAHVEGDPQRSMQLHDYRRAMAGRMLHSNVFDESAWRRLDWADDWPDKPGRPQGWQEEATEELLAPLGLSLRRPTTVSELYVRFDPERMAAPDWRLRKVNGKLCFGIPTVAFHAALLADDAGLAQEAGPHVRDMVGKMLSHGRLYSRGENFNRAAVLGLHLIALEARDA